MKPSIDATHAVSVLFSDLARWCRDLSSSSLAWNVKFGVRTTAQRLFGGRNLVRGMVNLAVCMASILVGIGVEELALRATAYGRQFHQEVSYFFPRFYYRPDSINGYDIAPNFPSTELKHHDYFVAFGTYYTVSSNELGCRDERMENEARYILLLGDSMTWAYVPFEQTFGRLVERLSGVRVLKCGVPGYGPQHERHKLEQVVNQVGRPRVIIVQYFIGNDLTDDYVYPGSTVLDGYLVPKIALLNKSKGERTTYTDEDLTEQVKQRLPKQPTTFLSRSKDFLSQHLLVYNMLRNSSSLRKVAFGLGLSDAPPLQSSVTETVEPIFHSMGEYPWLRDHWTFHLDKLGRLKQAADKHNATLLMVITPTADQIYEYLRPESQTLDSEYPNRRLKEYFERTGIRYLDLLPELRRYANLQPKPALDGREDLYFPHDRHLNVKGNRLAGLLISRHLLEQSFVDVPDKSRRLSDIHQQLSRFD